MSRAKKPTIAIVRKRGVCLEVKDGDGVEAGVEVDSDGDVTIHARGFFTLEVAKALAAAIVQACEAFEAGE
jgi:hypothetical protein